VKAALTLIGAGFFTTDLVHRG